MILAQYIPSVRNLIQKAAVNNTTVPFPRLFDLFHEGTASADVYDTLEEACVELADWKTAIYSVVMAKSKTGLPGDGFFDIYRVHRNAEYKRVAGNTDVHSLTHDQRVQMVQIERPVVFAHARV